MLEISALTVVLLVLTEFALLLIRLMRAPTLALTFGDLIQRLIDLLQRSRPAATLSCALEAELLPALLSALTRLSSVSNTLCLGRWRDRESIAGRRRTADAHLDAIELRSRRPASDHRSRR